MPAAPILAWIGTHGLRIVIVLAVAILLARTARVVIERFQRRLRHGILERDLEWQRRASTLTGLLTRLVTTAVWFVALLMCLRELSVDVIPILTGAGIAGLAVGFGAQNLVRDVISGFFLILEDQVRVGDIARINGVKGIVESVNLRTLVLRDGEGAVHVFPNGVISALANFSKDFANAIVDVRVLYGENLDDVIKTIREVGALMKSDPQWAPLLLGAIDVGGVEFMGHGFATIRARFTTQPFNQGKVANELRGRLVTTLAARGVKPYAPKA